MKRVYQLASLAAFLSILIFFIFRPGMEGDTQVLVDGSFNALQCVKTGVWTNCPGVGQFTILQYLPSWVLEIFGASKSFVIHTLCYISLISGALCSAILYRGLKPRGESVALTGLLVLVGGFWMRYLNLSFGEMLASFITLGLIESFLFERGIWIIGLFAFATTISKDTAFPFVLFFIGAMVFSRPEPLKRLKKSLSLLPFVLTGIALNIAFNFFRFGSFANQAYLEPRMFVHDLGYETSFFFGEWFSPSGGLWLFWPSFALVIAGLGFILLGKSDLLKKVPAAAILLSLAGMTAGFSNWYCPLGGICWGSRFFLPWGPALAFFALWTYAQEYQILLQRLCSSKIL